MGSALPKGGPAGLFIGFVIWAGVMWAVNECFAEMVSYLPVPSPFIRFGGEWVEQSGNHEWVARPSRYALGRVLAAVARRIRR